MRIVHVTPHLPPDQAANALLPFQLGEWARERGDSVAYIAHPPRAGGRAAVAGPVTWIPRRSGGDPPSLASTGLVADALAHLAARSRRASRAPISCTCTATGCWRKRARGWRRRAGQAGGADAVRDRDLALPAEAIGPISSRARIARPAS